MLLGIFTKFTLAREGEMDVLEVAEDECSLDAGLPACLAGCLISLVL